MQQRTQHTKQDSEINVVPDHVVPDQPSGEQGYNDSHQYHVSGSGVSHTSRIARTEALLEKGCSMPQYPSTIGTGDQLRSITGLLEVIGMRVRTTPRATNTESLYVLTRCTQCSKVSGGKLSHILYRGCPRCSARILVGMADAQDTELTDNVSTDSASTDNVSTETELHTLNKLHGETNATH